MSLRVLIVPSILKGNGSGHIVRSFALARALGEGSAVYLPATKTERSWSSADLALSYTRELEGVRIVDDLALAGNWDLLILDRRSTSADELLFWEGFGPVLALDEGGAARASASYLLDILPRPPGRDRAGLPGPNRASLGFLDLPAARRSPPTSFKRVLVSFGGEDPAGLALPLARDLLRLGLVEAGELTVVSGALRRGAPPVGLEGATLLGPVQDLKEHLHGYDLVLTQFGLTAFEAAAAGCGVILLNPGDYHRSLARGAGFPEVGIGRADARALRRWMLDVGGVIAALASLELSTEESLAGFIAGLEPSGPVACPSCGSGDRRALHRNPSRSYFRCGSCGMVYLTRFGSRRLAPYTREYFFEEYRRQYGRSYLDDWPGLTALAASRLAVIEELAAKRLGRGQGLSLLDVGCAYGPCMAAAKARGHDPYGIDVSPDAARYVREELGLPALAGDFADPAVAGGFGAPFDCLSMWYVIEHLEDLGHALRNAAALLGPRGILALSTPSGEGVSARFAGPSFFEASPEDHFTIWEPSRVADILALHGFRLERIRVTGHHPERFPLARSLMAKPGFAASLAGKALLALLASLSRLFAWGDTFEIYASREGAAGEAEPPLARRGRSSAGRVRGEGAYPRQRDLRR